MNRILIAVGICIASGAAFMAWFLPSTASGNVLYRLGNISSISGMMNNENRALREENANLKARIFEQSITAANHFKVYSNYPFNNKQDIAIAAGLDDGVAVGDVVLYGDHVLIGKVKTVSKNTCVATTIFDISWQSAVRVGEKESNGLFKGGNDMLVDLIVNKDEIAPQDAVVSASGDLPYGLVIGKVREVREVPGEPFKRAMVDPVIRLQDLRDVTIRHQ